jgi:hypothetical protein
MRHPKVLEGMGHADRLAKAINYVRHVRANTLEQVITALELCTVGDLLERHSLSAALSRQYSRDILTNHIKLINLEEIQTKIDIAQYDLHYASLRPERKEFGDRSLTVRVKMHVRGSSENRPKITLGSQVLLRPVAEDIQLLPTFGWAPQWFELRGICVHYQLSTEEATFEFPIVTMPHDVLFTRLRFHVRFDYERCGFLFVQWAVGNILCDPYLTETLFPNEDTLSRLRVYFNARRDATASVAIPTLTQRGNDSTAASNSGSNSTLQALLNGTLARASPVQTLSPGSAEFSTVTSAIAVPLSQQPAPGMAGVGATGATVATFNAQQSLAIETIVALAGDTRQTTIYPSHGKEGVQGPLPMPPFVIYGPPGTGKVLCLSCPAVISTVPFVSATIPFPLLVYFLRDY